MIFCWVEFIVYHHINTIKDPLGCSKEIHLVCDYVAHFLTWITHVKAWIMDEFLFVVERSRTPYWNIGQTIVANKLQRPWMMWSFQRLCLSFQKLTMLLFVQMRSPLSMCNNGWISTFTWRIIGNAFQLYWNSRGWRWVQPQTTSKLWF